MAEEAKVETGEVKQTLSPVQEKAMEQGWVPRDEFEGDEDAFIDAAEFVRRGELFSKIDSLSKKSKAQEKALRDLAAHNARVEQAGYDRARKELLAEKKTALAEGDVDRVVDIEEQIDNLKTQQSVAQQAARVATDVPQEEHPELQAWKQKNSWYLSSKPMTLFADALGTELAREGFGSPREILAEVERQVKAEFKEKFTNAKRNQPGAVEGTASRAGGKSSDGYQLTEQQRKVMNTLVSQGVLTKEKYIADLKAIDGIE